MDGHRSLPVWRDARALVLEVYGLTRTLPTEERFVTVPQLLRAAWSVPNNIAEGSARRGRPQLRQFLNCALGSLAELDSMIAILADLYALDRQRLEAIDCLRIRITRAIFGIMRAPGR